MFRSASGWYASVLTGLTETFPPKMPLKQVYPRKYGASSCCRTDNIIHFRLDFPYVLEEISLLRIQLNYSGE